MLGGAVPLPGANQAMGLKVAETGAGTSGVLPPFATTAAAAEAAACWSPCEGACAAPCPTMACSGTMLGYCVKQTNNNNSLE